MPNSQFSYINYWRYWQYHKTLGCYFKAPRSTNYEGAHVQNESFFYLKYVFPVRENPHLNKKRGWKIHISVDDSPGKKENLMSAWDIVKDILIENKIETAKVVIPTANFSISSAHQYGKQITLFCHSDPHSYDAEFWKNILQKIETAFCLHGIRPDPTATYHHESTITGSKYFTYRNDARICDTYQPHAHILARLKQIPIDQRSHYAIFEKLPKLDAISKYDLPICGENSMSMMDIVKGINKLTQAVRQERYLNNINDENALFNALSDLSHDDVIIESLQELCEGSYDTYKRYYSDRDYTNNYMPFENPLINIQVVSQDIAVKSSHWCERAFKKKQEKLNEVDNPLHNNHST